ncbi:ERMES complex subunit mmm1 [Paraconiothyrium brasiliense]|uniref:Maintenance of mitochondrial morphology protein 1 n=1 Tax=Paraconiothyrium brasiliense TaxID=300254 RepID=A0ABR3RUY4_9PLEO
MAQQPTSLPQPATQGSTLSFTQGFLLGQLSIALILFVFIKFFIFGELPSADDRALHLSSLRRARTLAHQSSLHQRTRSNSTTNPLRPRASRAVIREAAAAGGPSVGAILAKTYYNVKGHQPESLDWFNVLIAQTIAQLRADARQDGAVLTSLTEVLNTGSKPSFLGEIKVTEIALGDEFPIFSNCRVMPAEEGFLSGGGSGGISGTEEGRLQARMDVDLSDIITLGIETTLVLNWPTDRVAVLPVALAVSVVRFSGTLAVSFIPSSSPPSTSANTPAPEDAPRSTSANAPAAEDAERPQSANGTGERGTPRRPTTLAFTFLDDYRLDLSVRSLVGSRSRLQDVPKIAQLIESRVHAWFDERAVEPRFQQIVLPSLWPRKKNTRGGEEGDADTGLDDEGIDVTSPAPEALREREGRPTSLPQTLEARIEAEGAKLREAEIRAGERSRSRDPGEGLRWRGEHMREQGRPTGRLSREWSAREVSSAMPGGLPR